MHSFKFIRFFDQIRIQDIPLVGGKNASLGEMYQALNPAGIPVPNGFAITAEAYRYLITENQLWPKLHELLDHIDEEDVAELAKRGQAARDLVYNAQLPPDLEAEILLAYHGLIHQFEPPVSLAIRSSATAEDLPTASFAGQQDTYLNIEGEEALLESCRRCFASLFTDRAIHYRMDQGFDHFQVGLSIGVQKMVRSDLASSGVMFSIDTETGFKDAVFITGAYGLGENVVQGAVNPDEFYIHKTTFNEGYRHILRRHLGAKRIKMIYDQDTETASPIKNISVPTEEQKQYCLSDDEVLRLADFAIRIENHYGRAMDIEWAKDGNDGQLYIVQARPETVASQKNHRILETFKISPQADAKVLTEGRSVGAKVATGQAHVIEDVAFIEQFKAGEILVTDITTPDWEPVMKMASAIITNRGGRTCHAAIIARELGIPAIVGCQDATEALNENPEVTVSCAEGDKGKVYSGLQPFDVVKTDLTDLAEPKTQLMLNIANPSLAFQASFLPNAGVGLARMEFIINESIKAHPMALLHPEKVSSDKVRGKIEKLLKDGHGHNQTGADFFVNQLSTGIATLAAAFYPKPVVVRLSDFKSNEYANLIGGKYFEPKEENPMLGFRGAARYISDEFNEAFELECQAIKRVREQMGFTNVIVMVPFVRTPEEARITLERMAQQGLKQGLNALKVYMMCEIPNNVVMIDDYAPYFDGISIGSNDLTQLVMGIDRDSELVAHDYDERNPAVMKMIQWAIEGANRNGIHSGLCGQAPSDYPEIAEFLVKLGIDSISLNPDSMLKTTQQILAIEKDGA